jgi:nucleoside-diphosphate-sugar epimerase
MSFQLVVARYNENVDWVKQFDPSTVVIYDKSDVRVPGSIPRKNIGREVDSFLQYVIDNYHCLPDYVVFSQGDPFPHMPKTDRVRFKADLFNTLYARPTELLPLFQNYMLEDIDAYVGMNLRKYYAHLFNATADTVSFSSGCQYIVPASIIRLRSKETYANIQSMLINTPILTSRSAHFEKNEFDPFTLAGWAFERLMPYVFSSIPMSDHFLRKRYLVTGGCGFIGSTLVKMLAVDHNVVVLDNMSTGSIVPASSVHFVRGDILDGEALMRTGWTNGIFHMAAMSKVLPSLGDPAMVDFCNRQNIDGTVSVLRYSAAFKVPIKVVYSASSTYYGMNSIPNVETQLPDCQTPYALSKYCGELQCKMFSELYAVPTVRLRYFMVFGPNEPNTGPYAVVSGIFIKNKKEGKPLTIHGDGKQTRDFVHVEDICQANILAMNNDSLINETFNVGTGTMISIQELADMISSDQIHTEPRKVDLRATLCDTTKMERLLGWKPTKLIRDYIAIA